MRWTSYAYSRSKWRKVFVLLPVKVYVPFEHDYKRRLTDVRFCWLETIYKRTSDDGVQYALPDDESFIEHMNAMK
jgi:hypothetical protein